MDQTLWTSLGSTTHCAHVLHSLDIYCIVIYIFWRILFLIEKVRDVNILARNVRELPQRQGVLPSSFWKIAQNLIFIWIILVLFIIFSQKALNWFLKMTHFWLFFLKELRGVDFPKEQVDMFGISSG